MTYEAMVALGLVAVPESARAFALQGPAPANTEVLILGAGLAGMSTAYELGKLGYHCTILEARTRPGGRCHTIRKGTASEEEGSTQVAAYDEGMYFNPGPMRIPHHHSTTLGYAKELGVPVEVFIEENDNAYMVHNSRTSAESSTTRTRWGRGRTRRSEGVVSGGREGIVMIGL